MIRLVVTGGPNQGREFVFREHDTFLVGRSRDIHFSLPRDDYLSRLHFLIEINPPLCQLQDLESHNGTRVNGQRVDKCPLRDGDVISVGITTIRVEIHQPARRRPEGDATRTLPGSDTTSSAGLSQLPRKWNGLGWKERAELILDHQAAMWEKQHRVVLADYLANLPSLVEDADLLVRLIAQELELRREGNESATPEQYLVQFPHLKERLLAELARQDEAAQMGRQLAEATGMRETAHPLEATQLQVTGPSLPPEQNLPGYRLVRKIGEGGMGMVFQAVDPNGETVAIKMIRPHIQSDPSTLARFLREAAIVRQLRHPNIVGFRDSGEHQGSLYFVMDFVNGTDAQREVTESGPLTIRRAVSWTVQLLTALEFAHARGFVHRDIKPANLLVDQSQGQEVVRLADFGLARTYTESQLSGLTCTGTMGGTAGFVAPEQILNFREVKPVSDQYSAAATLYHLLSAQPLHDSTGGTVQVLKRVLSSDPVPLQTRRPELPSGLTAVVHKALARSPEQRYPSVTEFRQALLPFTA